MCGFRRGAHWATPPTLFWRILQKIYEKNTEMNVQMPLFPDLGSWIPLFNFLYPPPIVTTGLRKGAGLRRDHFQITNQTTTKSYYWMLGRIQNLLRGGGGVNCCCWKFKKSFFARKFAFVSLEGVQPNHPWIHLRNARAITIFAEYVTQQEHKQYGTWSLLFKCKVEQGDNYIIIHQHTNRKLNI